MAAESSGDEMDDHCGQLRRRCRLCGNDNNTRQTCSTTYIAEFQNLFGIDLSADQPNIHPRSVCHKCRCMFDRYKTHTNKETYCPSVEAFAFKEHNSSCTICYGQATGLGDHSYNTKEKRGRKRKRKGNGGPGRGRRSAKEERDTESTAVNTSQTSTETNKAVEERDAESTVINISTQTSATVQKEIGTQTDASECGYIIDANEPGVSDIPLPVLCKLVKAAAQAERPSIRQETKTIAELHKEPQTLSNLDPASYYSNRNSLCTSFVDGLSDEKTSVASKVMTVEQMYHLVSPVLVAPFTFARNLLCYAATNSKLVVNMLGKVSAGGMIDTVKSYLENMATKPLPFPSGDCEVAIDNDQKLKKQWSVRAQGKMTCSVVTSVCQVEHGPEMDVQSRGDLSPASWGHYIKDAQEDESVASRLEASLKPSQKTSEVHRAEVRKLVHQRLLKVANEQKMQGDQYVDYVDACVADKEKKKIVKQCGACGLEVPKSKRICPNSECQARLKQAEEAAAGKDRLGTMILAPLRKYTYRPKETEVVFNIDSNQAVSTRKDITVISPEEHADIPSSHPHTPPPITMSDPVFVNPNSATAMRKVLRHVGKISNIFRYNDNSPGSRKWLVVAMDGLPLGITRNVIKDTLYCNRCKVPFASLEVFQSHVEEEHVGEAIPEVREFDWVILRVGKLHLEMNALKSFVDLNWDVWFAALAEEMGFKSEGAQRVAKSCADHHKSMQLLQIAIKGVTDELLVPYVREKLRTGEQQSLSADDFLYCWGPKVRNPNVTFLQEQVHLYGLAIKNFHVGTRRNNTQYVQAGMEVFSPLFSGRNHPKYQMIDMLDSMDRAMCPEDLRVFMEKTESVTHGNRSLGEGMDAKLEEKNKASKVWHRGAPLAADWVRVFRNLDVLQKLRARFFEVIGIPDTASSDVCNRYNQEPEVDVLHLLTLTCGGQDFVGRSTSPTRLMRMQPTSPSLECTCCITMATWLVEVVCSGTTLPSTSCATTGRRSGRYSNIRPIFIRATSSFKPFMLAGLKHFFLRSHSCITPSVQSKRIRIQKMNGCMKVCLYRWDIPF